MNEVANLCPSEVLLGVLWRRGVTDGLARFLLSPVHGVYSVSSSIIPPQKRTVSRRCVCVD